MTSDNINTSFAIIGAGFSGTMLAVNLIKRLPSNGNYHITLIEKSGTFARGIAYSTEDPVHFLNVPVIKMGAYLEDPMHFFRWLQENEPLWRPLFPNLEVKQESFLPRRLYAIYLQSLFEEAKRAAKARNIDVLCVSDEAIDASPMHDNKIQITLKSGALIQAECMILATSLPPSQRFHIDPNLPPGSYIDNMWQTPLKIPNPESRVAIIGSGLTTVDAAASLINNGFKGEIVVISRHGHFPEPHLDGLTEVRHPLPIDVKTPPKSISMMFKQVFNEIEKAQKEGYDWRLVIDSLRPVTVELWEGLPLEEKKRFIRHVLNLWNRLRHRIPPEGFRILQRHKIEMVVGNVTAIQKSQGKHPITVVAGKKIEADYVINCSGPQMNIRKSPSLLFQNLLSRGMVTPHPLNMGIMVDEFFQVIGKEPLPIYAVGQLLYGQKLESIAVPELRMHCAYLVKHLVNERK